MPRPTPDDLDLSAEREHRLDRDDSREPRVAIKRITTDEDRREMLRLNFAAAFTTQTGEA